MYEYLYCLETTLHKTVRDILKHIYGPGEKEWWEKGVPLEIRKNCVIRREEDLEHEPYCYVTFLDMCKIIKTQWRIFKEMIPKKVSDNKQELIHNLEKINKIRNVVMHPMRGVTITQEDFDFVKSIEKKIQLNNWIYASKNMPQTSKLRTKSISRT